jgi:uncharacterized membrane protein
MTGSLLIFIGVAFIFISALSGVGSVSGGGIILIGPIPIVFGAGPDFLTLLPIAVAITIMAVVLFLLFSRRSIL